MTTVTPHWKLRRLAPRAIRVVSRRAMESAVIASYTQTTIVKAKAYIAAYDLSVKFGINYKKEMEEGRSAIAVLLKLIQSWAPALKRDVPGFDGSVYGDQPQVPDDVIEDGERMVSVIDEYKDGQGNPLTYRQAACRLATVEGYTREAAASDGCPSRSGSPGFRWGPPPPWPLNFSVGAPLPMRRLPGQREPQRRVRARPARTRYN